MGFQSLALIVSCGRKKNRLDIGMSFLEIALLDWDGPLRFSSFGNTLVEARVYYGEGPKRGAVLRNAEVFPSKKVGNPIYSRTWANPNPGHQLGVT